MAGNDKTMKHGFFGRIALGAVLLDAGLVFAVIALVIYIVNATGSYYGDFAFTVPVLSVAGMAAMVLIKVLTVQLGNHWYIDVLYPVAAVLMVASAMVLIKARAESAAVILASRLESGNQTAMMSLMTAFVAIGCFIVAMLLVGISGCFQQRKEHTAIGVVQSEATEPVVD